jgi:hypothetical protein
MVHIGGGVSGVDAIKRVTAVSGVLFIVWCLLFRYSIVYRRAPIPMRLYRASTRASTRALPRALYPCCVVLFLRHLSPEFSPQEAKIIFLASALLGALRAACRRPLAFALGGAAAAAPPFLAAASALIGPRPLRAAAATVMNC